jgi:hypothetical protein
VLVDRAVGHAALFLREGKEARKLQDRVIKAVIKLARLVDLAVGQEQRVLMRFRLAVLLGVQGCLTLFLEARKHIPPVVAQ